MRKFTAGAIGLAFTAIATSSWAARGPTLEATAGEGACGGSIQCAHSSDVLVSPATNASVADSTLIGDSLADGSYADAHAIATFGALHAYSDAFRASGSDAQSTAQDRAVDYVPAALIVGGMYTSTFAVTGSHSDVGADFGNHALAFLLWDTYDSVTGVNLDSGEWESTDAVQEGTITHTFAVPVGHGLESHVDFETDTYSSFGVVDEADYSETLDYYLASVAPGPDLVGLSGHDYAPPAVSGAPEPASWVMMLTGVGLAGSGLRRRRPLQASAAS